MLQEGMWSVLRLRAMRWGRERLVNRRTTAAITTSMESRIMRMRCKGVGDRDEDR